MCKFIFTDVSSYIVFATSITEEIFDNVKAFLKLH